MTNKNDHTAFQVSDLDASIRFYTESLGLRLLSRSRNLDVQEAFAFIELEGGNLELIQKLDQPFVKPRLVPPYCPHLALQTEDLSQVLQWIAKKGIPVVQGLQEVPGELRWIYISDPDNNVIEYIEWAAKQQPR